MRAIRREMKIAICGKGGVGKSTVSALLAGAMAASGRKVLAIDADPSPHLARLLGISEEDVPVPIARMKELLQERSQRNGPFYNMNPKVDDLPARFMKEAGPNIRLMVLGAIQQGGAGCACAENAVLRNLLNMLLLSPDEEIILDMEAGVEHLGRGTIAGADHILIVVQPYRGSIETAGRIDQLAKDLGIKSLQLVANGVMDQEDLEFIKDASGVEPIGIFPASKEVRRAERNGQPIYGVDPELDRAAADLLDRLAATT